MVGGVVCGGAVVVVVVEGVVVSGGDSVVVVVVIEDAAGALAFCPQPTTCVNISRKAMTSAMKKGTCFVVAPPESYG